MTENANSLLHDGCKWNNLQLTFHLEGLLWAKNQIGTPQDEHSQTHGQASGCEWQHRSQWWGNLHPWEGTMLFPFCNGKSHPGRSGQRAGTLVCRPLDTWASGEPMLRDPNHDFGPPLLDQSQTLSAVPSPSLPSLELQVQDIWAGILWWRWFNTNNFFFFSKMCF